MQSENAVQKAQNRAVGSEEIETRLRKCGSTQFYAGDVGTDIGDDIFLSASEIIRFAERLSRYSKRRLLSALKFRFIRRKFQSDAAARKTAAM